MLSEIASTAFKMPAQNMCYSKLFYTGMTHSISLSEKKNIHKKSIQKIELTFEPARGGQYVRKEPKPVLIPIEITPSS